MTGDKSQKTLWSRDYVFRRGIQGAVETRKVTWVSDDQRARDARHSILNVHCVYFRQRAGPIPHDTNIRTKFNAIVDNFNARQHIIQSVLAIVILSVRHNVPISARIRQTPGFRCIISYMGYGFCDKILCCWVKRFFSNAGAKSEVLPPPQKKTLYYRYWLVNEDEFLSDINTDDFEQLELPKYGALVIFVYAIFVCGTYFESKLQHCRRTTCV